ncbi:MAG: DUF5069 domain-containing protein [Opitutaceae bacterium]|nr:DUF5069 domain-containing protein [Opitutaceae bacterium]
MIHYTFAKRFRELYDKAVSFYRGGRRGSGTYFNASEETWLKSNGLTAQHLYDYAEDDVGESEPGYDIALGIELVRRDYFLNVQQGIQGSHVLDAAGLPPKSAAVHGIHWLPRIIPKARAKLRGELPATLMYCCGGDRGFFTTNDIHPQEFLSLIWRAGDNDRQVIDWVVSRSEKIKGD